IGNTAALILLAITYDSARFAGRFNAYLVQHFLIHRFIRSRATAKHDGRRIDSQKGSTCWFNRHRRAIKGYCDTVDDAIQLSQLLLLARIGVDDHDCIIRKHFLQLVNLSAKLVAKLSYVMSLEHRINRNLVNLNGADIAVLMCKLEPVCCPSVPRSEERRVGKECRSGGWR